MATYTTKHTFPYRAEQMFEVVADVEHYPDFLPLWKKAKVIEHRGDSYDTDQVIMLGVKPLQFRSRTVLKFPNEIKVTTTDGLFRELIIHWFFDPASARTCEAKCAISYEMRSPFWQMIIDPMLCYATQTTVSAFEDRAHEVYGTASSCPA